MASATDKPAGLLIGLLGKKPKETDTADTSSSLDAIKALRTALDTGTDQELLDALKNLMPLLSE